MTKERPNVKLTARNPNQTCCQSFENVNQRSLQPAKSGICYRVGRTRLVELGTWLRPGYKISDDGGRQGGMLQWKRVEGDRPPAGQDTKCWVGILPVSLTPSVSAGGLHFAVGLCGGKGSVMVADTPERKFSRVRAHLLDSPPEMCSRPLHSDAAHVLERVCVCACETHGAHTRTRKMHGNLLSLLFSN